MPETNEQLVLQKLEIIIRLQALSLAARFDSQKDKILFLRKSGFALKDIADLLDTSPNVVNVTLVKARQRAPKATSKRSAKPIKEIDSQEQNNE